MIEHDVSNRLLSFLANAVAVPALPAGFGNRPALTAQMTATIMLPGPGLALVPMPSGEVTVMTVNQPLPGGVVKDDVAQNALWTGWKAARAGWRSHLIVSTLGMASGLERTRAAVRDILLVAQELTLALPIDGVYWAGSDLMQAPADFRAAVAGNPLPVSVLVRCNWWQASRAVPPKLFAQTHGLGAFGLPELIDETGCPDPVASHSRLLNLASYLIANGQVIGDGETVGNDQGGVRVHHSQGTGGEPMLALRSVEKEGAAWPR